MASEQRGALARRRRALGLSQQNLAQKIRVDAKTVGRWERGESEPHPWQRSSLASALHLTLDDLDQYLLNPGQRDQTSSEIAPTAHATEAASVSRSGYRTRDLSVRLSPVGDVMAQIDRRTVLLATASTLTFLIENPVDGTLVPARPAFTQVFGALGERWPGARAVEMLPYTSGDELQLLLPSGRSMPGTIASIRVAPAAVKDDEAVLESVDSRKMEEYARRSARGFIAAAIEDESQLFLLDARAARSLMRDGQQSLAIPRDFELDDLTFAILWAVANLDDALLSDDRALDEAQRDLSAYERLSASSVGRESAPDLNPIAHMYLGSDFCARYILRSLWSLDSPPIAWTKEQHGEEASTWLLFDHKYRYLRETASMAGDYMQRGFCVPATSVASSPTYERILLFLAVALMESLGIHVHLTADASYAAVEGFVIARQRSAIIANWVGGDGMWHVDLTSKPSTIRQFGEVAGDVAAHSVIAGSSPARRLSALADYLELDRSWLSQRCFDVGHRGTSSLIQSRSRLISPKGLDAACRFVGTLHA